MVKHVIAGHTFTSSQQSNSYGGKKNLVMSYTNVRKISEMIFPFCAAQIRPQLKYQLCLVLASLERR